MRTSSAWQHARSLGQSRRSRQERSSRHVRGRAIRFGQQVYVISDGTNIKIGIAKDPQARLRSLQIANPKPLTLLYVFNPTGTTALQVEKRLHKLCRRFKLRGEWHTSDALAVILSLVRHDDGVCQPDTPSAASWRRQESDLCPTSHS